MKYPVRIISFLFMLIIFVYATVNVGLLESVFKDGEEKDIAEIRDTMQKAYVSDDLWLKNSFLNLNGLYARLIGRQVHNGTVMLNNGMLGSETFQASGIKNKAEGLTLFVDWLEERDTPFLYVQMPYKLDAAGQLLPVGVENNANHSVDELLSYLNEFGVKTLDLREQLSATQEMVNQTFYRTDHHWTPVGAFRGFQITMQALQEIFPEENLLAAQPVDMDKWTLHTKENQFLGSYGKRVGEYYAGVDDLIWLTPNFETRMSIYIPKYRRFVRGSFEDTVIQKKYIDDKASLFDLNHYCVYIGGDYPLVQHRNELSSSDKKVLIIKDSFSLPYQSFLSTVFSAVDVIDPRHFTSQSLAAYVETTQPDAVILAINPSVLESQVYFSYTLPAAMKGVETVIYQQDISFVANDNKYLYKVIDADLEPGVCYQVVVDDIVVESGDTSGVFLAVYDFDTKTFYDTIVFDLEYCQAIGEYNWRFCTPVSEKANVKLLVYSGLHGDTDGVAVSYKNLVLAEYQ